MSTGVIGLLVASGVITVAVMVVAGITLVGYWRRLQDALQDARETVEPARSDLQHDLEVAEAEMDRVRQAVDDLGAERRNP